MKFLKPYRIHDSVLEDLRSKYKIVFNPSFLCHENTDYYTVRVGQKTREPKIALLIIKSPTTTKTLNLTELFGRRGIDYVADPKLYICNDRPHFTFNTGYSPSQNRLFICEIDTLRTRECRYKNRNLVEKNWAFFSRNKELYCLYSLYPLVVLKATNFETDHIDFDKEFESTTMHRRLSIGTQLLAWKSSEFLFLSHWKLQILNKRIYFVQPMKLHASEGHFSIEEVGPRFSYSVLSIFGSLEKSNPHLISCTYASGISKAGRSLRIGIGINDQEAEILQVEKENLWS